MRRRCSATSRRCPIPPPILADPKVKALAKTVPPRPPGFCIGCPERPIFAAMKLVEKELGPHHVSADIGCHLFSILPPFNIGATTMGYGLGPASASAFNVKSDKRVDLRHGRRRLLAQRPRLLDRQCRVQQAGRRHPHRRQFLFRRDRRAGHPVVARLQPAPQDQQFASSMRSRASARTGSGRSTAPMTSPRCATRCARR